MVSLVLLSEPRQSRGLSGSSPHVRLNVANLHVASPRLQVSKWHCAQGWFLGVALGYVLGVLGVPDGVHFLLLIVSLADRMC